MKKHEMRYYMVKSADGTEYRVKHNPKKQAQKYFLEASRRYPRNFAYKNVVGVTLYKEKEHNAAYTYTKEQRIILRHVEGGSAFDFDAQDYGTKEARVWISSTDPHRLGQSIANLDFDLVEISRKDFDGHHGLILTRWEIFGDRPVDNGFLGEWFERFVQEGIKPSVLTFDDINHIITERAIKESIESGLDSVRGACTCSKCTQEGTLERGWYLSRRDTISWELFNNGWRQ